MDELFFHPKLVHLPMALAVLMPLVAGGLILAILREWLPPRAWLIAVLLQGVLVASSVVALRSGEEEEERVEAIVAETHIEAHEEAAQGFTAAAAVVLALSIAAQVLALRPAGRALAGLAALGTLVVLLLGYRAGEAGGDLVYRHGAAAAYLQSAGTPAPSGGQAEHEEAD